MHIVGTLGRGYLLVLFTTEIGHVLPAFLEVTHMPIVYLK